MKGHFVLNPISLGQPGLDSGGTVLRFPIFQRLVIAAFGFDDFANKCLSAGMAVVTVRSNEHVDG